MFYALHDRPEPGARRRRGRRHHPVHHQGHGPELGPDARQHQEAVPGRRQDLRHRLRRLHDGPGLQQGPVHPGRPRPEQAADHLAGRRRPTPRRSRTLGPGVAGYEDYSAGNTGGWHFTAELYSRGGADVSRRRQDGHRQHPRGGRPSCRTCTTCASTTTAWASSSSDVARPADERRRRQGRHVHRRARHDHRDRDAVPGRLQRLGDGPDARRRGPAKGTLGGGSGYMFKKVGHARSRSRPASSGSPSRT